MWMEQLELSHCQLECITIKTLCQSVWQFEVKYPATLWYRSWIPRCSSKRHEHMSAWYKKVHSSFIIREWINKSWYIHTMEYDSAIKRGKVLIYDKLLIYDNLIDLKTTVLDYRSHTHKNTHKYILYESTYTQYENRQIWSVMLKSDQLSKRVRRLLGIDWKEVHKGVFWGDGNVCCLVLVVIYVGICI